MKVPIQYETSSFFEWVQYFSNISRFSTKQWLKVDGQTDFKLLRFVPRYQLLYFLLNSDQYSSVLQTIVSI